MSEANTKLTGIDKVTMKAIIESLLFVNEKPLEIKELIQVFEVERREIEESLKELIEEYSRRGTGLCIVKIAGGYQMCTSPSSEQWIKKLYRENNKQKLSGAALESLAIIAYKQPITRMEIEAIRGVNVDGVVRHLLKLGLIKLAGRKDVIGKPFLYVTTRKFLEYFGLNSLKELPKIEEFIHLLGQSKIEEGNELVVEQEEEKVEDSCKL